MSSIGGVCLAPADTQPVHAPSGTYGRPLRGTGLLVASALALAVSVTRAIALSILYEPQL